MRTATDGNSKLERALAESKVISANLEHLATRVADIDPQLEGDLQSYAGRFDEYVRRLGDACERERMPRGDILRNLAR